MPLPSFTYLTLIQIKWLLNPYAPIRCTQKRIHTALQVQSVGLRHKLFTPNVEIVTYLIIVLKALKQILNKHFLPFWRSVPA